LLCSEVEDEKKIVLSGDGRHDSMGHSAKYCAYSLFCHDPLNSIIDFSLVQVGIVLLLARISRNSSQEDASSGFELTG
jgi:hypothetical protein